jgi:FKBP-type peptidyl-prolyl cis-trans isomerase FkpA
MKQYLFLFLIFPLFSCCLSEDEASFKIETEEDIIKYIANNNLNAVKTDSGLYYVVNNEGLGERPKEDSDVTLSLKGSYLNGTVFSENNTGAVNLKTQVLGLVEGLQLFKEGGDGILIIPSNLGFNNGSVLVIDLKLIDVIDNDADILKYLDENNLNATKTDSGLYYIMNEEGTGNKPTESSVVTVAYKGYFLDGTVFDESDSAGITLSLNQVIAGWTEGIQLFKEGGEGTLLIPFNLAYGLQRVGDIPGGAVLVFDINLITVN